MCKAGKCVQATNLHSCYVYPLKRNKSHCRPFPPNITKCCGLITCKLNSNDVKLRQLNNKIGKYSCRRTKRDGSHLRQLLLVDLLEKNNMIGGSSYLLQLTFHLLMYVHCFKFMMILAAQAVVVHSRTE